ncbi:MAG: CRISPR-associated endonuclease Cas2, partial [Ardenticatenaceae bacterium]
MYVVVSYDSPDDKRRTRVMKALKDFGARVQYSVFECDLSLEQFAQLRQRLRALVVPKDDDVRFYFLCESCLARRRRMGRKAEAVKKEVY